MSWGLGIQAPQRVPAESAKTTRRTQCHVLRWSRKYDSIQYAILQDTKAGGFASCPTEFESDL